MTRTPYLSILVLSGLAYGGINLAYPTGAPERHTGGAGESDCSSCHFGELNGTPPELSLNGLKGAVRAGSRQILTLQLSHTAMRVAGIQATIRAATDNPGRAGRLVSEQLNTLVKDGIAYLNHRHPLQAQSGTVTVTLQWDVPMISETAVFNAALVAANDDLSPFGDSVVKIERVIEIIPR